MLLPTNCAEIKKKVEIGWFSRATGWHTFPTQAPPWQLWPQAPQLAPSVARFAQALGHTVRPLPQVVQVPPTQAAPLTHWLLSVQAARQAVAPQMKGVQPRVLAAGQFPAPSQLAASVPVPVAQLAARQLTVVAGNTQAAPAPVQVDAQVPVPAQAGVWPARGAPVMKVQVPGVATPVPLQASQDPEQARLQQTPSAQTPLLHSVPSVHAPPFTLVSAQVVPAQ
jgi:hypothetical protein